VYKFYYLHTDTQTVTHKYRHTAQKNTCFAQKDSTQVKSACLVTGSSAALIVRVGDGAAKTGVLDGFDNNPLCDVLTEELVLTTPKFIRCRRALIGRFVSIRVVDYVEPIQLKLCEVDIITA